MALERRLSRAMFEATEALEFRCETPAVSAAGRLWNSAKSSVN